MFCRTRASVNDTTWAKMTKRCSLDLAAASIVTIIPSHQALGVVRLEEVVASIWKISSEVREGDSKLVPNMVSLSRRSKCLAMHFDAIQRRAAISVTLVVLGSSPASKMFPCHSPFPEHRIRNNTDNTAQTTYSGPCADLGSTPN